MNPPLLFVEGVNDLHVVKNLLGSHKLTLDVDFRIQQKQGVDPLRKTLPVVIKGGETVALGVVIDADLNLGARWDELKDVLTKIGYTPPKEPDPTGLILSRTDLPTIGIWIMPDNQLPGILEDFVTRLAENDSLLPLVQQTIQAIPETSRRFAIHDTSKAVVHTWLAWQAVPGLPMGQGITKKYLDVQAPTALVFVDWVRRLIAAGPSE